MYGLKLYSVSDSPPTLAVRMTLNALEVPYQLIDVNFAAGEHLTETFAKINPQREIPCIDDNGFCLSESVAILQYLADKYGQSGTLYPNDCRQRAIVNHRLAFNLSTYYRYIAEYVMAPIFYAYERNAAGLNKVKIALNVLNTFIGQCGRKFVAGDELTIADFPLVTATMCLEAIAVDISAYPHVVEWYSTFKKTYPALWNVAERGMLEIRAFDKNPPNMSAINHPIHPIKKH